MIVRFIVYVVFEVIGFFAGAAIDVGTDAFKRNRRRFVCGLRVVSGIQPGLSTEWLVGDWRIRRGRLIMDALDVPISSTLAGSRRMAKPHEIVGEGDTIVISVRTPTAVLDWSLSRRLDGLAFLALDVPESPADPSETDHSRLSAREAAEHIRWGLERSDEKYAVRYLAQTISDFRRTPPDRVEDFLVEPETTADQRFDTLLATAIGWECTRQGLTPPAWTVKPRLATDWVVWPYGTISARWADYVRGRTPSAFASKRIFIAEKDLELPGAS